MNDRELWKRTLDTTDGVTVYGDGRRQIELLLARRKAVSVALEEVFDVLDDLCGETDPFTDVPWEEWDDEDIKSEEPLFWCCRKVAAIIRRDQTCF